MVWVFIVFEMKLIDFSFHFKTRNQRFRHTNECGTSCRQIRTCLSNRPKRALRASKKEATRTWLNRQLTSTFDKEIVSSCRSEVCSTPKDTESEHLRVRQTRSIWTRNESKIIEIQWRFPVARSNIKRHLAIARKGWSTRTVHKMVGKRRQGSGSKVWQHRWQEKRLGKRVELSQCGWSLCGAGSGSLHFVHSSYTRIHVESSTNIRRPGKLWINKHLFKCIVRLCEIISPKLIHSFVCFFFCQKKEEIFGKFRPSV